MKKIFLVFLPVLFLVSCSFLEEEVLIDEGNKNIEKTKILALWDSLTAGYNLDFSDSYPSKLEKKLEEKKYNYKVINAWVSWDTSKNLLSRVDLYNEEYEIVLLNIWWNDWLRSLDLKQLKDNIIEVIDSFPDSKIVLFSVDLPLNYPKTYRNKLEDVYEEVSKEKDVYFYWLFFEWLDYNKHFLNDKIHPNKDWYEIISENIMEYLIENKLIKND